MSNNIATLQLPPIGNYNHELDTNHFLEGLRLLLKHGANPNEVNDSYGRKYPALAALLDRYVNKGRTVMCGDLQMYKTFVAADRQADKMWEGTLAVACVKLLLEFHADPSQGFVLHKAVETNNPQIVKLLIESGKINISQRSEREGDTPLMLAAKNNL